ncbi:MAG: YraN family protein [Bdellovibrionales bacterium]|nr:YraN family protein [Bdellovibrionales bacterium]
MWKVEHKRAIGSRFERRAEEYLKSKGYRILERNVNFKGGELDLVCEEGALRGGILVFVEVRMRDPRSFVSPEESLLGPKIKRLKSACRAYLSRYSGHAREIRIDLISWEGEVMNHREGFVVF